MSCSIQALDSALEFKAHARLLSLLQSAITQSALHFLPSYSLTDTLSGEIKGALNGGWE
jgi:hypothetical protein